MIKQQTKEINKQQLLPEHDILFEDIGICPIDDHSTFGVDPTIIDNTVLDIANNNLAVLGLLV